ncbi:hypothetical protein Ddc_06632 [Ditylenchus destructor]|nr:hypothetical protein Ddc_06632 [Ditylenchus destructor]
MAETVSPQIMETRFCARLATHQNTVINHPEDSTRQPRHYVFQIGTCGEANQNIHETNYATEMGTAAKVDFETVSLGEQVRLFFGCQAVTLSNVMKPDTLAIKMGD